MLKRFKGKIEQKVRSLPGVESEGLDFLRKKIYFSVSLALVILGLIAYIPSVIASVIHGFWSVVVLDTIAYCIILILYYSTIIPFAFRVYGLLFMIYLLGIMLLLLLGTIGAGLIWLFAFPVLASLLMGFRSALFAIAVNCFTFFVFEYLLFHGMLTETMMGKYDPVSWGIVGINFLCLNFLVSIPIAVLINDLEVAIKEEMKAKILLKQEQITLHKKNEDLKRINNDLDNFIYTASHDLRAPVNNIEGLVSILKQELGENQKLEVKEAIDLIRKSTGRFHQTIESLTEVSKTRNERLEELFEDLDVEEIFNLIKLDLYGMINKHNPCFHFDFKAKQIKYLKKDLISIMYNLVSNAIKYHSSERPCQIWISTEIVDGYFKLVVKDNGLGMRADYQEKLFKMFRRLHDHVEGTGVGLYIIKRMVENHGGKVEVNSQLDEGSEFKVYLKV